jgi:hypothetical protein
MSPGTLPLRRTDPTLRQAPRLSQPARGAMMGAMVIGGDNSPASPAIGRTSRRRSWRPSKTPDTPTSRKWAPAFYLPRSSRWRISNSLGMADAHYPATDAHLVSTGLGRGVLEPSPTSTFFVVVIFCVAAPPALSVVVAALPSGFFTSGPGRPLPVGDSLPRSLAGDVLLKALESRAFRPSSPLPCVLALLWPSPWGWPQQAVRTDLREERLLELQNPGLGPGARVGSLMM